jgi:hypothetical protein
MWSSKPRSRHTPSLRAWAAGGAAAALTLLAACGGSPDGPRTSRPATTPQPVVQGAVLATSGAVDGTLVPQGVPTCTTTTATLYGEIGGEKYSLTVIAPFANYPGGQTITLPPPPQIDAGVKLVGVRAGPWAADHSGGSGLITVGQDLRSGSFDAKLVGADGSRVAAVGSWDCGGGRTTPST